MTAANTYAELPADFYQRIAPTPVRAPQLLLWNGPLADELQFDATQLGTAEEKAAVFAGNATLPGFDPIALAYAGHQFGSFVPSLGDGRAHLLGEVLGPDGLGLELQLKGSGRTRFSRGGDGRCAMGPAVRELIMGEAMFGLGISTTRSLCVVATGETVQRQRPEAGAVVTRMARSHLRVGTFQYFAARRDAAAVRTLVDYAVNRLFPDLDALSGRERVLAFFERVVAGQIATVIDWMRVGFIHGVMNTDNTSISGETIDFGPCAMMNAYHPGTVFSSIDEHGRYAFANQPGILAWNMARLAECLLPLLHDDGDHAIEIIRPRLDEIPNRLQSAWQSMMGAKIGIARTGADDASLMDDLLALMQEHNLDYTNTFVELTRVIDGAAVAPALPAGFDPWLARWKACLRGEESLAEASVKMRHANPLVIPRNHHVEAALAAAERGDAAPTERLIDALRNPYNDGPSIAPYTDPPQGGDGNYRTFCGT